MKLAALALIFAATASASCTPIAADRILGSDLALADPSLAAFPPAMTVAFSPAPGTPLIIPPADILRLAKSHSVSLESIPAAVCFAFTMRKVSTDELSEAMRRSLPAGASVDVIDSPKEDLPAGELHFPLNTLEPGAEIQTWRGFVQYSPTHRTTLSARVRLQNGLQELILNSDVSRGTPFAAEMFTARPIPGLSPPKLVASRPEQLLGNVAKADLKAGQRIPLTAVELPVAVRKGDIVQVEVRSGSARLQLDAVAQRAARDGEIMEFLNPLSGKTFKARLEGSRAIVNVGGRL